MEYSTHIGDDAVELGIDTTTFKKAKDGQVFKKPTKSKILTLIGFW